MRLATAVLASALVGVVLAGCSQPDAVAPPPVTPFVRDAAYGSGFHYTLLDAHNLPVPFWSCRPTQATNVSIGCNINLTPDEGRQGNEVTLAVNPTDPRNIVGGAKDYYPADAGQCVWDGIYVTHDGGRTPVADRSFDGSPWRLASDPQSYEPNYASQFWCTTDPVAYFDLDGRFYYLLMAYQADPVTGGDSCAETCPEGALNDWLFNRAAQIVAISDDGGDTFATFTPVFDGSTPILFNDKGWIAASPSGTIHVMWLGFSGFVPGAPTGAAVENFYFRSTDGGQSYTEPFVMASPLEDPGQGSFLEVGVGSEVYALWTSGVIHVRRSTDEGATWLPTQSILAPHDATMPGLSDRDRRGGFPVLATDRNPDSPLAGAVYVAFQDSCSDAVWTAECKASEASSIYLTASFDKGATFGAPVRVSGDEARWRIFPAVSVSPGGVVDVSWMEEGSRIAPASNTFDDDAPHPTFEQAYAYSLDGGGNWSAVMSVRDAADGGWDPALCHHQNGKIFIGDYNDIDSSWQAAHPVWPDSRDGANCKVYAATIERPWFATGWDEAKRVAAEVGILAKPL